MISKLRGIFFWMHEKFDERKISHPFFLTFIGGRVLYFQNRIKSFQMNRRLFFFCNFVSHHSSTGPIYRAIKNNQQSRTLARTIKHFSTQQMCISQTNHIVEEQKKIKRRFRMKIKDRQKPQEKIRTPFVKPFK